MEPEANGHRELPTPEELEKHLLEIGGYRRQMVFIRAIADVVSECGKTASRSLIRDAAAYATNIAHRQVVGKWKPGWTVMTHHDAERDTYIEERRQRDVRDLLREIGWLCFEWYLTPGRKTYRRPAYRLAYEVIAPAVMHHISPEPEVELSQNNDNEGMTTTVIGERGYDRGGHRPMTPTVILSALQTTSQSEADPNALEKDLDQSSSVCLEELDNTHPHRSDREEKTSSSGTRQTDEKVSQNQEPKTSSEAGKLDLPGAEEETDQADHGSFPSPLPADLPDYPAPPEAEAPKKTPLQKQWDADEQDRKRNGKPEYQRTVPKEEIVAAKKRLDAIPAAGEGGPSDADRELASRLKKKIERSVGKDKIDEVDLARLASMGSHERLEDMVGLMTNSGSVVKKPISYLLSLAVKSGYEDSKSDDPSTDGDHREAKKHAARSGEGRQRPRGSWSIETEKEKRRTRDEKYGRAGSGFLRAHG